MLIDSHCHLDRLNLDAFEGDMAKVVGAARNRGVQHMLCVSVTLEQFPSMLEIIAPFDDVSASCGVHPLDQDSTWEKASLNRLAQNPRVVAVGETGLDYYYSEDNKAVQQAAFVDHIEVARNVNKPLIIHTRDAQQDTLAIMREGGAEQVGGVFHCFTESWDMAKAGLDLGFYISISGIVTFKNASALRDVAKKVPLDRLLVETDSPYLAPVPYRGKQNQPAYVREVAEFVAELKSVDYQELEKQTGDNFFNLFPLAAARQSPE